MATPPDFVSGQILTAAQMSSVGLWLVKSQTIGSAVSSVNVTGAFSADYDVYLITVSGGVASTDNAMNLTLGATATGYYSSGFNQSLTASTIAATNTNNGTSWTSVSYGSTNALSGQVYLDNPFAAKRTMVSYQARGTSTTYFVNQQHGMLNNATSYTDFTLTVSAGTVTGGTVRVYGYRN
jgi:hypothetical protein